MDSLGEKLRQTREEKSCTLEQVSRDTNIATRYLQALETEDFSGFPGEPYILGFLRNYSEYLGLDVQEQLSRYRALKIQEQPVPVDQLLHSPVPVRKIILSILIPLLILGLGAGAYYFVTHWPVREQAPVVEVRQPAEYAIETGVLERRFYAGDSVLVSLGEVSYELILTNLGEAVTITSPLGQLILALGQEVLIDLNSDGIGDLRIVVSDFARNDSAAGAMLHYELITGSPGFVDTVPVEEILASATVIQSSPNPYPFTTQLNFQGYCMFRWEILFERNRQDRKEQYFQRGEELNIQAQNGIRVWASNAQSVKVQIIGGGRTVPVELGSAGEVVAADIRWDRDADNRYRLILVRLN